MPELDLDLQLVSTADDVPTEADFVRWVTAALAGREQPVELTIRVVDEEESAALNLAWRQRAGPTNVLSFPFVAPPGVVLPLLGDIVICAPLVVREAREQGKHAQAHWAHLTLHGCLHLLGYDHLEEAEAQTMENLEISLLSDLGYANPYE